MMLKREAMNLFLLAKSHLLPDTRLDSVGAVLRDLVALDANNLDDAYFSLYLRVKRFDVSAFERGLYAGTSMARVKGLKNYMQVIPQDYLSAVYAISRNDRETAARNLLGTWGIHAEEYRSLEDRILGTLAGKEKTLVQLKKSLGNVTRDVIKKKKEKTTNVSIAAQAMQDRWLLLRGGVGRQPGENPGRYSIFKERFTLKDMGRDEAMSLLARRYVKTYGPVSAGDLAWWLGVNLNEAARALASFDTVEIEGVPGRFFMDKDEAPGIDQAPSIIFLPKDDPYVKAYYDDARFVPPGHDVITKFGESASVVLVDGTVWGTWALEKDTFTDICRVTMYEGHPEVSPEGLRRMAQEAGRFYRGGPVDVMVRDT